MTRITSNSKVQTEFLNKFKKLPKTFKVQRWSNGLQTRAKRIDLIQFAGKKIDEQKLTNYFLAFENRYRAAQYCLQEIKKDCETRTENESKMAELKEIHERVSITYDLVVKSEYFIFALVSCLDTMSQILNKADGLGINEQGVSFETVYKKIKNKRDVFSLHFLKARKKWAHEFRGIRNRMVHHQIINFSSNLSHNTKLKKITLTKNCISVLNNKNVGVLKPLPKYFEEIIKNYEKFRLEFYKKLNSII